MTIWKFHALAAGVIALGSMVPGLETQAQAPPARPAIPAPPDKTAGGTDADLKLTPFQRELAELVIRFHELNRIDYTNTVKSVKALAKARSMEMRDAEKYMRELQKELPDKNTVDMKFNIVEAAELTLAKLNKKYPADYSQTEALFKQSSQPVNLPDNDLGKLIGLDNMIRDPQRRRFNREKLDERVP